MGIIIQTEARGRRIDEAVCARSTAWRGVAPRVDTLPARRVDLRDGR